MKNKGGRPRKLQLNFDRDSINKLLQECYRDSHSYKSTINQLFTKWEKEAQEGPDIAAIGDSIIKALQLHLKNQDQKLLILKYLKDVVFAAESSKNEDNTQQNLEDEARNAIIDMANEKLEDAKKAKDN